MKIVTSKYQLPTKKYTQLAMWALLKKDWWYVAAPIVLACGAFITPSAWYWWVIGAGVLAIGYLLFWYIQFAGLTQLEQGKFLFERLSYEITSQQILIKLNPKQGMPLKWNQIKRAFVTKEGFVLCVSKAQLMFFPYKIFNNDNQVKFLKTVLKNKGLIKGEE